MENYFAKDQPPDLHQHVVKWIDPAVQLGVSMQALLTRLIEAMEGPKDLLPILDLLCMCHGQQKIVASLAQVDRDMLPDAIEYFNQASELAPLVIEFRWFLLEQIETDAIPEETWESPHFMDEMYRRFMESSPEFFN